jgi:hypothetical protein
VYRPNEAKVRNLKTKDYLGKARLVAASDRSNAFTGFAGTEIRNVRLPSNLPPPRFMAYLGFYLRNSFTGREDRIQGRQADGKCLLCCYKSRQAWAAVSETAVRTTNQPQQCLPTHTST